MHSENLGGMIQNCILKKIELTELLSHRLRSRGQGGLHLLDLRRLGQILHFTGKYERGINEFKEKF